MRINYLQRVAKISTVGFIMFLTMIVSCASQKKYLKPRPIDSTDFASDIRERTQGEGQVKLLEHQLLPIDYLHKHPEQKGLIVNHYMGTGKTFLSIGFAQSFPDRPVILLAPGFLESHWHNQIKEFGVVAPERFRFVSYDDAPNELADVDLSQHLLLIDEAHNLIKKMRSIDIKANEKYTKLYLKLRNAYKIVALTGTPIYTDESDLAFLINLVSGQDLMPFNQETFRLDYTKTIKPRQFFRGYLSESNLINTTASTVLGFFFSGVFSSMIGYGIGIPLGIFTPVLVNAFLPPNTYKLRELNVEKMMPILNKYVSYFRFDEQQFQDFPAQDFKVIEVPYSRQQYSFFLHLVEGDLPVFYLQRLLQNDPPRKSDEVVSINSTQILEQIYSTVGAGRDIGNFEFVAADGSIVEPPKFLRIYENMKKHPDQRVIYSNYYQTGILAFEQFLKRQGYSEKYAIINPQMNINEVNNIVADYNRGEIKLLLLHPEVTEGISLKGTQYLDILEPMLNATVLEQVIGRTRRFQSHSHLPKEKQLVHVHMWQSTSSSWNPDIGDIKRANWFKRYRELSYMSRWGIGIVQVDKNYEKKALNPEELALLKLRTLEKNLSAMQKILTEESIEKYYAQKSAP